jgi:hypothetical protein
LPGGANITTAAGTVLVMVSLGSGNWRCIGTTTADSAGGTVTGNLTVSGTVNGVTTTDWARKSQSTTFTNYLEVVNNLPEPFEVNSTFNGNVLSDFYATGASATNYIRQLVNGTNTCRFEHTYNVSVSPTLAYNFRSNSTGVSHSFGNTDYHTVNSSLRHDFVIGSGQAFAGTWAAGNYFFFNNSSGASTSLQMARSGSGVIGQLNHDGTTMSISSSTYGVTFTHEYSTGNTWIAGTYSPSDIRIKENVQPLVGLLDKVCALTPVEYNKIKTPDRKEIGFIAQDVQLIRPEVVSSTNHAGCDVEDQLGLDYARLSVLYAGAIKELKAEIDSLKAEISLLKST